MQNYRSVRLYSIFLIIFFITVPDISKSDNNSETTQDTIKSASELDYPPFSIVLSDGTADGFSVELLSAAVKAIGKDISFIVGPWNELKQKLIDGHFDVLPLVSYSDERDKVLDFSTPYLRMHGTIFVRTDEKSIHTEADLKDKEVLVMKDDTAHEYAISKKISNKLILKDSFEEAMRDLSNGKHDALIVQQLVGYQLMKKLKITNIKDVGSFEETNLKPSTKPFLGFEQKFCFAVPEGKKELLSHLNEGLSLVIADGTFDELYHKWFGPILPQASISFTVMVKYLISFLVPILFIISIAGIWYLKREVARKTKYLKDEISERMRAEISLQTSEKKSRSLLNDVIDNSDVGLFILDSDINVVWINTALENYFGLKKEEVIGKDKRRLIKKSIKNIFKNPSYFTKKVFATYDDNTYIEKFECHVLHDKERRERWLEHNSRPIKDGLYAGGRIELYYDITERKQAEKEIQVSLKEKEILLQEVYHRTKNNMQVISAIIDLQTKDLKDEAVLHIFKETQNRINSMSLVHEKLYQSKNLSRINLMDYFLDLINLIGSSYQDISKKVKIITDMEAVMVTIDSAIPCGLIMNELISNTYKHAFPEQQEGEIHISLKMADDKTIEFVVSDNGIGLSKEFDIRSVNSLGLQSVGALAEHQLYGSVSVARENGALFQITFKEKVDKIRV